MGGWYTATFEFGSLDTRDEFMDRIADTHPVDFPDPATEKSTSGRITTNDGSDAVADIAWIGNYIYITCSDNFELLIRANSDLWWRAAYATFDPPTETCEQARLFTTDDAGDLDTVGTYEGVDEAGGSGLVFEFTMHHQFRFRSYASAAPKTPQTPLPSAYDAVEPTEENLTTLEELTGVDRTDPGVAYLDSDYTQTTDFVNAHGLESATEPLGDGAEDADSVEDRLQSLYEATH